jgi:hypothetical protein
LTWVKKNDTKGQKGDVFMIKNEEVQEFSGYRLKRFLDDAGLKYGKFGKSLNPPVSIYTMSKWLNGKGKPSGPHGYAHRAQISVLTQRPGIEELHATIQGWDVEP